MNSENIAELETLISAEIDTIGKVDAMNQLAFEIRNTNTQRSILLCKAAQKISQALNYAVGNATALSNEAFCYVQITDYELALEKLFEALKIFEDLQNEKGIAQVHYNLCLIYFRFSDFSNGLDSITKSLAYYQKTNNVTELARCYFQTGFLYHSLDDFTSAIDYLTKSLELNREVNNRAGEAAAIMGLGQTYLKTKEFEKSHQYLVESMAIREQIQDWRGYAASLNAYMTLCLETGKRAEAEEVSLKGIQLATELGDKMGISRFMLDLGKIYFDKNNTDKAEQKLLEALEIADKINLKMALAPIHLSLSEVYESKNDFEKAFRHFQKFHKVKEEMINIDAAMKAKSIQFVNKIENAQKEAEINRLKNVELKNAYEEIAEKNKDITDSINYARRIQYALLASDGLLTQHLPEYFVLFKPKDVVSGDFYWAAPTANGFLYITADCTGHGVPGAFMSLLNISKLSQTINENKIIRPDLVLNNVRTEIIRALNAEGSDGESKDGMDAILCHLDLKNMKLEYAAANNSFYIIRNKEIIHCKADKMPVGKGHDDTVSFTYNQIHLQKGDTIYTFTDGLPDQFGGPKGKKFKRKQLEAILLGCADMDLKQQQEVLSEKFDTWKGELEQVDDVCVMGVRV